MNNKFGDFLYSLRKEKGYTQADLAAKLNITNKAVSKWETGEAFPDTAQLLPLSDIFSVTVDELLRGERNGEVKTEGFPAEKKEPVKTENQMSKIILPWNKKEAVCIALSIALILSGVLTLVILATSEAAGYGIYVSVLLICVAVAVFILIFTSMGRNVRSAELSNEESKTGKRYILMLSCGVMTIIFSVAVLIILIYLTENIALSLGMFFGLLIIGITVVILGGILWGAFMKKHDVPEDEEIIYKPHKKISDGICGIIMLLAICIFLLLGFLKNLWHIAWVVYPVGGVLCAIVTEIVKLFSVKKDQ